MSRAVVVAGIVVAAGSAALLASAAGEAADGARPVPPSTVFEQKGFPAAAREALGRRVLVLSADPGKPRKAALLESGRAPEGWALYPGASPRSPSFGPVLDGLAAAAGAAWDRDRGFPPEIRAALEAFAVKALLVDDAGKGARPVQALDRAEPVLRIDESRTAPNATAVEFVAGLRTTAAKESEGWTWSDWEDSLWGGAVTVETSRAGRFLFPYPAEGARATVDGAPAKLAPGGPLVAIDLPAGKSRVEVGTTEPAPERTRAILGGAGLVVGLLMVVLSLRPSRAQLEAAAERQG